MLSVVVFLSLCSNYSLLLSLLSVLLVLDHVAICTALIVRQHWSLNAYIWSRLALFPQRQHAAFSLFTHSCKLARAGRISYMEVTLNFKAYSVDFQIPFQVTLFSATV